MSEFLALIDILRYQKQYDEDGVQRDELLAALKLLRYAAGAACDTTELEPALHMADLAIDKAEGKS